ncbi:hypothetical protein M9458_042099, partial [Cirrhinus mrigala]
MLQRSKAPRRCSPGRVMRLTSPARPSLTRPPPFCGFVMACCCLALIPPTSRSTTLLLPASW